jgi:plastocyanin
VALRDIYLKIEPVLDYSPVRPDEHVSPPIVYMRDCMRNPGHEDGTIPADEVNARRLTALIYREYLDAGYLIPKPDKIVVADVNEPAYMRRVPGTVIYASPGDRLRIHVKNADVMPHSFHVHGLRYGIDSDGSWPFGTQALDGRRSDEICPGQNWTYTFDVTKEMIGAWPFHDHCRDIAMAINRGLFGGIIVLERDECDDLPRFEMPKSLIDALKNLGHEPEPDEHDDNDPGGDHHGDDGHDDQHPHDQPHRHDRPRGRMATMPLSGKQPTRTAERIAMAGAMPMPTPGPMPGAMSMPGPMPGGHVHGHGLDLSMVPESLRPFVVLLDELAHAPQHHLIPKPPRVLHVPIFLHQMSGARGTPVFQSGPLTAGAGFTSPVFSFAATYNYFCGIHGPSMAGTVNVVPGGPSLSYVTITDNVFTDPVVTVGVGGQVVWTNNGPSLHSVVERGGASLPSYCFNGRAFIGNSPTILAESGQKIRWYVFNLDLGMNWHNFHPHAQRWRFAGETIDIRSIGPAESFVVDTVVPQVLTLPQHIEQYQPPHHPPKNARPFHLRGEFLFHCHVEMHMMQGLAGLVRARQTVWLTRADADLLSATIGLPLDPGDNACPAVDLSRCANAMGGKWEELPGLPGITFMHAVLLPNTTRLLFWGYGPQPDQSRLWDQATGLYTSPANQPADVSPDQDLWSGAHAFLDAATSMILAHGGYRHNPGPPMTNDTERRAFFFDPATSTWSHAAETNAGRFYPTTLTLANGSVMTLFGQDSITYATVASFEIFTPGGVGSWSAPKALPFNYFYYPWTFQLPNSEIFIAGPQKPARRVNWTATPVVDDPSRQYSQVFSQRGVNMDGTAVLLPLRPPSYAPRVLIAGGATPDTQQSAEWIDLSAATPAWQALPPLNVARDKPNSVLLPDGRVVIVGGILSLADGGPAELFDPADPSAGFELGPSMKYHRHYHSAAILLPDGSVIVGGDPNGPTTPHERYLPPYFFQPRPAITTAAANIAYGANFTINTPQAPSIGEVVLVRPGAVTHGFNQSQRVVGCSIVSAAGGVVQATAPPNGNIAPPGYYLLFVVDHDRIPSMGVWTRLG